MLIGSLEMCKCGWCVSVCVGDEVMVNGAGDAERSKVADIGEYILISSAVQQRIKPTPQSNTRLFLAAPLFSFSFFQATSILASDSHNRPYKFSFIHTHCTLRTLYLHYVYIA